MFIHSVETLGICYHVCDSCCHASDSYFSDSHVSDSHFCDSHDSNSHFSESHIMFVSAFLV